MEAKFFQDDKTPGYNLAFVKIDEHSLRYLQQGLPLRMAFFTDQQDHLPWYKRNAMVVMIGKHFDFQQEEQKWKDKTPQEGMIDRSYLLTAMQDVRQKLIGALSEELNKLGVSTEFIQKKPEYLEVKSLPAESVQVKGPVDIERKELDKDDYPDDVMYWNMTTTAKMLKISVMSLKLLAEKGRIKGKHDHYWRGWAFPEPEINKLLETKPDFLTKIWDHPQSVRNGGKIQKKIEHKGKEYIHLSQVQPLIKLSSQTLRRYIDSRLVQSIQQGRSIYVSSDHLTELVDNPPEWLSKAWSYFNGEALKPRHSAFDRG